MKSNLALLVLTLASTAGRAEAAKPNVVLIVIDDLGRNDLGCYGSKYYRTPNLDRLAAEGMKFEAAYAACPVCSPTRAALMTGKTPARLHLTDWLPGRGDQRDQKLARPAFRQELPLSEDTIAEALKRAGYVTGHVGKWHLGGPGFGPKEQGFDVNVAGNERGSPTNYFAPYKMKDRQGNEYGLPGLESSPPGEYLTDRLTTEAEKFIDANKDKPFFLYIAHYDVHTPIVAKSEYVEHYPPGPVAFGRQSNRIYAAKMESMDESVGRVLKKLKDLRLDENTVVIFTSDNGGLATIEGPNTPATYNGPLREGKGYLYEGGIRVPWIVKWPRTTKPGTTTEAQVISYDVFPTLLEITGAKSDAKVEGVSFVPTLKREPLPERALYWHYPHYANQGGKPGAAIREGDWKLIEFYEDGRRELFRVGKEIGEGQNLIDKEPAVAAKLFAKLEAWRKDADVQRMRPNPNYLPNPQAADGSITLPAKWARVYGTMLRYEPLPHKNTLGYWVNASDYADWEFTVTQPGTFVVEALQGCGTGNGGSEVEFSVEGQTLTMIVEDTGHFQNFKNREIGRVVIDKPGRHVLTVKPKTKAKAAVMDLRRVRLLPVK